MINLLNSDSLQKLGLMMSAAGTSGDPGAFEGSLDLYKMLQKPHPPAGPPDAHAIETGTQALFSGAPTMGYGGAPPPPQVTAGAAPFANGPMPRPGSLSNSLPLTPIGPYGPRPYR